MPQICKSPLPQELAGKTLWLELPAPFLGWLLPLSAHLELTGLALGCCCVTPLMYLQHEGEFSDSPSLQNSGCPEVSLSQLLMGKGLWDVPPTACLVRGQFFQMFSDVYSSKINPISLLR